MKTFCFMKDPVRRTKRHATLEENTYKAHIQQIQVSRTYNKFSKLTFCLVAYMKTRCVGSNSTEVTHENSVKVLTLAATLPKPIPLIQKCMPLVSASVCKGLGFHSHCNKCSSLTGSS